MSGSAPAWRAYLAMTEVELRLAGRRGENLLVTLVVPIILLVFLANVELLTAEGTATIDLLVPSILALAVLSTGMVALGISTAFERSSGVLKRLGGSPLPTWALIGAKTTIVAATVGLQLVLVVVFGWLLGLGPAHRDPGDARGWHPVVAPRHAGQRRDRPPDGRSAACRDGPRPGQRPLRPGPRRRRHHRAARPAAGRSSPYRPPSCRRRSSPTCCAAPWSQAASSSRSRRWRSSSGPSCSWPPPRARSASPTRPDVRDAIRPRQAQRRASRPGTNAARLTPYPVRAGERPFHPRGDRAPARPRRTGRARRS